MVWTKFGSLMSVRFLEYDILHAGLKRTNTAVKRGQINSEDNNEQRCIAFIGSRLNA